MKVLKDLKLVLLILLAIVVLVIIRSSGKNRFNADSKNVIETIKDNNFWVSENELQENESQFLVVDLNQSDNSGQFIFKSSIKIPFENLLEESSLQRLKEAKNKILLYSDDNSFAVKAWVILNQLEFENVFVLSNNENPEVLKYEFQPDTLARLESVSE